MKEFLSKINLNRRISEFILFSFFKEIKAKKENINFIYTKDNYQLRKILRNDWEKVMLNLFDLCNNDTLFIDVGANIGIVSCLLSKKVRYGFAFEPVPSSFSRLVRNIDINNIKNIIPLQMAASNTNDLKVCTNLKNALTNYILDIETQEGKETALRDGSVKSLSIKLDELVLPFIDKFKGINILIKIDVEGHESFVLEGSSKILSLNLPITICLKTVVLSLY